MVQKIVAVAVIGCAAAGAIGFLAHYERDQRKVVFWRTPALDPERGEYYEAFDALRPLVTKGMRIAYHEAGFVPFMLGVENIDMLGLTSPFIGRAPTENGIFTDVGRYHPLQRHGIP